MKTVLITETDQAVLTYVAEAREENLILQLPDGSEFLLAEIDTFAREVALTRDNEKLMALNYRERNVIFWEQLDEPIPFIALLVGVSSQVLQRSIAHFLFLVSNQ